ncbi:MAG: metallophosphatase family protein [Thermoplasmata archaeon]|nr:metallophosphatase family protein [Thermoplasmata archaeon]
MRIGIVADTHSNIHALKVVLETLDALGLDSTVCAGDIVGYGANPNECCREIKRRVEYTIAGNHDCAALTRGIFALNPYAAAAALWTNDSLYESSSEFLSSLPITLRMDFEGKVASVFHGSDRDPNKYVHQEEVDDDLLSRTSSDMVILGHTHIPYAVRFGPGLVVNPGSVGQPRDGDARASCAVVDTKPFSCDILRVEYDIEGASQSILKAGLPATLAFRLSIGR